MPAPDHDPLPADVIIDLQTRLAYQEHSIEALSEEVARQQQVIDRLAAALANVITRLDTVAPGDDGEPEPPPPHY
jgi:SlyX protein